MKYILCEKTKSVLEKIKNEINHEYGFHNDISRINYGPCGVFAKIFFEKWNDIFEEKVHICFVLTKLQDECDHIVIRLPSGNFLMVASAYIGRTNILINF